MGNLFAILAVIGSLMLAPFGLAVTSPQDSAGDVPPQVLNASVPSYPPIAAAPRACGKVIVEGEINPEGRVVAVKGISGHPLLVRASEKAAGGWRFAASASDAPTRKARLTFDYDLECSSSRSRVQSEGSRYYVVFKYEPGLSPRPPTPLTTYRTTRPVSAAPFTKNFYGMTRSASFTGSWDSSPDI